MVGQLPSRQKKLPLSLDLSTGFGHGDGGGEAKISKSTMTTSLDLTPNTEATFLKPNISQSKRSQKTIDHGIESL